MYHCTWTDLCWKFEQQKREAPGLAMSLYLEPPNLYLNGLNACLLPPPNNCPSDMPTDINRMNAPRNNFNPIRITSHVAPQ